MLTTLLLVAALSIGAPSRSHGGSLANNCSTETAVSPA